MLVDACFCVCLPLQVVIKNDILELTLSNPGGIVTGVRYNGVDNLMEILNKEDNRGYQFHSAFTVSVIIYFS
jgi:hypothetical protein